MITPKELRAIARARLQDADALFASKRYDGAIYVCGYAIELSLKARICSVIKWQGYPSTNNEFKDYQTFRTHDLDVLLHLSGREKLIKFSYLAQWSTVNQWNPSARYKQVGTAKKVDAQTMKSSLHISVN